MLNDARLDNVPVTLPFVTVIVTNFNYREYIVSCLESIARQTCSNFKCIIVDDCSIDDSRSVIEEFIASSSADGRFSLICHEENRGQMGSFITGLRHAEGPFVVFVDADDLLLEDFLAAHIEAHSSSKFEPVAFTSSNQYQINEKGEVIGGTHPDLRAKGKPRYVTSMPIHKPFWVWATTSSMMFRRSALEILLQNSTDKYRICADFYVCHFANLIGGSLLLPTVHGCYRRHGNNNFSNNSMVGGCHPTGDMGNHPKHYDVRLQIFQNLCNGSEHLIKQLSMGKFFLLMAYSIGPFEVFKFKDQIPKEIPKIKIILLSLLLRIRRKVPKFKFLSRKAVKNFDYGEDSYVLKLPRVW